jgi:hypothetical protein
MRIEGYIIVFISLAALPIFMFFRNLLDNRKTWLILLKISSVIAATGVVLTILGFGLNIMYLGFIIPLYSIAIYRPLYLLFKKGFHREPIDTAGNWNSGLFFDRVFNIVYVFLTIAPIFGIFSLYAIINNSC